MLRTSEASRLRTKALLKKQRYDPTEVDSDSEGGWSIYYLVREEFSEGKHWYVTDLKDIGKKENRSGLTARKLDMDYPEKGVNEVGFGSYGTLIYGVGGYKAVNFPEPAPDDEEEKVKATILVHKFFQSVFFYDTANPEKGWVRGPNMIATRSNPCHRVVNGKLYVLGGLGLSYADDTFKPPVFPWGECLDLSAPDQWKWHPLEFPLSPLSERHCSSAFDNLPIMMSKTGFDPQGRHILLTIGWPQAIVVCYDVHGNLFLRVPGSQALTFHDSNALFPDGGYVFTPNHADVLAVGIFGDHCFVEGSVEGMYRTSHRLPPARPFMFYPYDTETPTAFSLVRLAPFKYATLWSPERDCRDASPERDCSEAEPAVVRLSVFTVCPHSPPIRDEEDSMLLMRAKFDVLDQHLDLGLQGDVKLVEAVAVPILSSAGSGSTGKRDELYGSGNE